MQKAVAQALGVTSARASEKLDTNPLKAFVFANQGQIAGFGGLATAPMHHEFRVKGRTRWTWCAWDSLFIPQILGETADVSSPDPGTREPVRLTVSPDGIVHAEPEEAVVSFLVPDQDDFEVGGERDGRVLPPRVLLRVTGLGQPMAGRTPRDLVVFPGRRLRAREEARREGVRPGAPTSLQRIRLLDSGTRARTETGAVEDPMTVGSRPAARAQDGPVMCPVSGTTAARVALHTVKALLTEAALRRLAVTEHHFCPDPACDVVYVAPEGGVYLRSDLRVPVWQKEPFGARMVCFCFGENEADMRTEVDQTGQSEAVARVRAHIQAERCACEVRNPRGVCCLGDVAAAVTRVRAAAAPGIEEF